MTNIKERVLLIAESKGIQKVEFFKGLGLSYANFKGVQKNSALGSDAITTVLNLYNDVNPEWLLNGVGNMYRVDPNESTDVEITLPSKFDKLEQSPIFISALEQIIEAQQATIATQEITINALTALVDQLEKKHKKKKKNK